MPHHSLDGRPPAPPAAGAGVLLVQSHREWPAELVAAIARAGYTLVRIDDVRLVPFFVLAGGVAAVLIDVRALEMLGALALRLCRQCSPGTSVVVMALDASAPTVKRALDCGATAFLSWPAPPHVVAQVLRSGSTRTNAADPSA